MDDANGKYIYSVSRNNSYIRQYALIAGECYIDFIDMITVRPFLKYLLPFYHSR